MLKGEYGKKGCGEAGERKGCREIVGKSLVGTTIKREHTPAGGSLHSLRLHSIRSPEQVSKQLTYLSEFHPGRSDGLGP